MNIESITFPKFSEAQCTQGDPDLYFPESFEELKERINVLRSICNSCIHKSDCAEFALKEGIAHGFWGGLTERERATISKQRGTKKPHTARHLEQIQEKQAFGWSLEDIAIYMGISLTNVNQAIAKGKKKGIVNE